MGKTTIRERAFPKIIEQYNIGGKTAAYDYLRSEYGIKHPYFVIKRIKECGKYLYDADMDHFSEIDASVADGVFMDLDELCGAAELAVVRQLDILVREYRCSGGTDTASPAAGNRCSGTGIPHLIDCYLRVYSLKAGSNPYTSRIER